MLVCLDNGHGEGCVNGSPDKKLLEYKYTRKLAAAIKNELEKVGIDVFMVTPEIKDIALGTRTRRVNEAYKKDSNCICVSLHNNAAGNGSIWRAAKGFSAHVSLNASNRSKLLADYIVDAAASAGLVVRKPMPNTSYWQQNLAMCRDTKCPAVLTESLFQDNKTDVEYLLSEEGFKTIVDIHVKGIKNYFGIRK